MADTKTFVVELTPEGLLRAINYFQSLYDTLISPNIHTLFSFIQKSCLFTFNSPNNIDYYVSSSSLLSAFVSETGVPITPKSFSHLMDSLISTYPHLQITKKRSSAGYRYIGIALSSNPTILRK